MKGLLAKKLGMTQLFNQDGTTTAVTVLEAGPCKVLGLRTTDKDGYSKDPAIRVDQLTDKYFTSIDDDDPDPHAALAVLPARDRMVVERYIEKWVINK